MQKLLEYLPFYLVFVLCGTVHEFFHAWSAWRLGDPTARNAGRMSLNPLVHIDPVGTVLFPLLNAFMGTALVIGWMRPVPVLGFNLRRPERDMLVVSLAGPFANILLALLGMGGMFAAGAFDERVLTFLGSWCLLNLVLALFNLLPVPPLDGSSIVDFLRRDPDGRYHSQAVLGMVFLYVLLATGGLGYLFKAALYVLWFLYDRPWAWGAALAVSAGVLFLFLRSTAAGGAARRAVRPRRTPLEKAYARALEIARRKAEGRPLSPEDEAWVARLRADPGDGRRLCSPVSFNGSNEFCAECRNWKRCAVRLVDAAAEEKGTA